MTERIADPQAVCPFVALDDDRDHRAPVPDHHHRCFAESPAAPRALAHQAAYCLSASFPGCPTFVDWARREAAPAKVDVPARSLRDAGPTRAAAVLPAVPPVVPPAVSPAVVLPAVSPGRRSTSRAGGSAGDWTAPPPWGSASGSAGGAAGGATPGAAGIAAGAGAPGLGGGAGAGAGARAVGFEGSAPSGPDEIDDTVEAGPDDAGIGPAGAVPRTDAGSTRQAPDVGETPAFLAGRQARPVPPPARDDDDELLSAADDADSDPRDGLVRIPVAAPRRMPVGYAPVAPGKGERGAGGTRRDRVDASAPSWEQPRRFEEYPTLKSRGGAGIPRPAIYALVVLLVGVGLFAAPFLLKGLGGSGQASPTPGPSASVVPTAELSPTAVPTPAQVVHTVKSGETLLKIAAIYGVTVDQILAANPKITNANKIAIGDKIVIPRPLPSEIVDPGITPAP